MMLATSAGAQETRDRLSAVRVPGSFTAPAGLCRLWIDGVPASQQPAPTDCANAIRNRPANAAVVFGPPARTGAMELVPFARRADKGSVRQLAPGLRAKNARDDGASRDEPRARPADTTAKPASHKPEKPQ